MAVCKTRYTLTTLAVIGTVNGLFAVLGWPAGPGVAISAFYGLMAWLGWFSLAR